MWEEGAVKIKLEGDFVSCGQSLHLWRGTGWKAEGHVGRCDFALDPECKVNRSWFCPPLQVQLPSLLSPESQKDPARVEKEDKQGKAEESAPASKRGEPARVKIFEGG